MHSGRQSCCLQTRRGQEFPLRLRNGAHRRGDLRVTSRKEVREIEVSAKEGGREQGMEGREGGREDRKTERRKED